MIRVHLGSWRSPRNARRKMSRIKNALDSAPSSWLITTSSMPPHGVPSSLKLMDAKKSLHSSSSLRRWFNWRTICSFLSKPPIHPLECVACMDRFPFYACLPCGRIVWNYGHNVHIREYYCDVPDSLSYAWRMERRLAMRRIFFHEPWNWFDLSCVLVTDVRLLLDNYILDKQAFGLLLSSLRTFRIIRLFRVVNNSIISYSIPGIKRKLKFPPLMNIFFFVKNNPLKKLFYYWKLNEYVCVLNIFYILLCVLNEYVWR